MPADRPPSTLTRPAPHLLKRFHLGQVGNDTIETFLTKGYSLAICCRDCPRLIEWTPPDLAEKFGDRIKLRIADLGARFTCTGEGMRFPRYRSVPAPLRWAVVLGTADEGRLVRLE